MMLYLNKLKSLITPHNTKESKENSISKMDFEKYLDKERKLNIVDIGAHNGGFVDYLKKEYFLGKVFLFEPLQEYANILTEKYPEYQVFNSAVAESSKVSTFYSNNLAVTSSLLEFENMEEMSNIDTSTKDIREVDTVALDSIEQLKNIEIDVMKIDVQGAEHLVIEGAKEVLRNTRIIYTEVSFKKLYKGSSDFFEIFKLLEGHGFKLHGLTRGYSSSNGEMLQADATFLKSI